MMSLNPETETEHETGAIWPKLQVSGEENGLGRAWRPPRMKRLCGDRRRERQPYLAVDSLRDTTSGSSCLLAGRLSGGRLEGPSFGAFSNCLAARGLPLQ
jgi:hypothetical protein